MFQHPNHRGAKGEEKEQEIENLLEKNNEGELPQSGKGTRHASPGHLVPKKLEPRRNMSRHITVTLPKIKDKEKILKASGEKETVTYEGVHIRL